MALPETLSSAQARILIDELLDSPSGPVFTNHMEVRSEGRLVSRHEVLKALALGSVVLIPVWDANYRSWNTEVEASLKDVRIKIPVAIGEDRPGQMRLYLKTVIANDI